MTEEQTGLSEPMVPPPEGLSPTETPHIAEMEELDVRGIVRRTIIAIVLLIVVVGGAGFLFRQQLIGFGKVFVDKFGVLGVMLGFLAVDGFTVPIPNDLFSFLGLQGKLGFWTVTFYASLGSLLGGSVGYGIGLALRRTPWFIRFMEGRGAETYAMLRRYGLVALGIAAFTPIPYSIACWASGAIRIPFGQFLFVSLLRVPRIALYLWLIQLGFVSFAT